MEESGWVEAEWRSSDNNRRAKYYRLTSAGRTQLKDEERQWNQVVKIMAAAVSPREIQREASWPSEF